MVGKRIQIIAEHMMIQTGPAVYQKKRISLTAFHDV
jgi:hypothetical protein